MTIYGARVLLPEQDSLRTLHQALASGDVARDIRAGLADLSPALLPHAMARIAAEADRPINVDLITVLSQAWQQYGKLRDAAHRSRTHPPSPQLVPVQRHSISWETNPQIEVLVDGQVYGKIIVTIGCALDIDALLVKVENASITALLAGR